MKIHQRPFPVAADVMTLAGSIVCLFVAGCGTEEALDGRVAIDVTIQVGGEVPESGTLVLKPERGVRSPLIRVVIEDGAGSLPAASGPVPGSYSASFRSSVAGTNIDDQLTNTGREMPSARARASAANSGQKTRRSPTAKNAVSVSVPNENPATLIVSFDDA
ncbi:MAG: hypothetical protein P8J37_22250 [Fuerstiella sp.]|nr:hypothetical protein [Fuerstiella sp.]